MAEAVKKNQKTPKIVQSFSAKDQKKKDKTAKKKKYLPYKVIVTFSDTKREMELYFFALEDKVPKDVVRITSDVDYEQHRAWLPEGSVVGLTRTPKLDNFRLKFGEFDFE